MLIKIGGFYKLKGSQNEYVFIQKKIADKVEAVFVDITPNSYSEDHELIPIKELEEMIEPKCYTALRSRKYEMFYAMWDGANKETFVYILPKSVIEDLCLKKQNFPEKYAMEV